MSDKEFKCPGRAERYWTFGDQWDLSEQGCTKIDADAAGIGVVVAFLLAASILLVSVVAAYFSSSIPNDLLNDFDQYIVLRFQEWLPSRLRSSSERHQSRVNAISQFLLSLAEQQLATALGLLIAAYAHWHDITIYSINITSALTLLASTVFTSVLPILTARGGETTALWRGSKLPGLQRRVLHGFPKHFRFAATALSFIGMAFLFVISLGENWQANRGKSDLYFLPGVSNFYVSSESAFTVFINFFILTGFASNHVDAAFCLYTAQQDLDDWLVYKLQRRWNLTMTPTVRNYVAAQARMRSIGLEKLPKLRNHLLEASYAFHCYNNSFASKQLAPVIFAFIYGTFNIFMTRDGPGQKDGLHGNPNTWSFGQIVPMVLLVLPILAAFEAYNDYAALKKGQKQMEQPEQGYLLIGEGLSDDGIQITKPITKQHSVKDDWNDNSFDPINCRSIRVKLTAHFIIDLLLNILFAVAAPLSASKSIDLPHFCLLPLIYMIMSDIRRLYGRLVSAVCLREPSDGGLQHQHLWWVRWLAWILCVANFILSGIVALEIPETVSLAHWHGWSAGPILTGIIWLAITLLPVRQSIV